jgi:hypothetical protein
MASFFEIGGKIFELENELASGPLGNRSAKDAKQRKQIIKAVTGVGTDVEKAMKSTKKNSKGSFEKLGNVIGFGIGMVIAIATVPVTQVDGPFIPVADIIWVTKNYQNTKSLMNNVGEVGEYFDDTF